MELNEIKSGDFVMAYKILKDLGTPWNEYEAFDLGLIDDKGKKLKSPSSSKEKDAYTSYMKIVFNLKRLLQKVVGKSNFAQKAVSLMLLKESEGITDNTAEIIVDKLDLRDFSALDESYLRTYVEANNIHI